MLTLKSFRHIRASRNVNGFRSCQHATAESLAHLDAQRIVREEARLASRAARRLWLEGEWDKHLERSAGPSRVLPASARSRQTEMR